MGKFFLDTDPFPGDTDNVLLAKILQRLDETASPGPTGPPGPATPPGGAPNSIQFNDAGAIGGEADFAWNKTTNTLTFGNINLSNPASDFVITNPTQSGIFRLLPFGNDIYFDNSFDGDLIFRPNSAERMRLTSGVNKTLLALSGQSLTGANAAPAFDVYSTWNTTGSPVALRFSITNTASGAAAKFLEFLGGAAGATSIFSVGKDGSLRLGAAGGAISSSPVEINSGSSYADAPTGIKAKWKMYDAGGASAGIYGVGISAGQFNLFADASASFVFHFGDVPNAQITSTSFSAPMFRFSTPFTVATLPVAGVQGRMAYVTDSLTPTFLTLAVGGGAVVTPVFDNGTNWVTV